MKWERRHWGFFWIGVLVALFTVEIGATLIATHKHQTMTQRRP